MMRFLGISLVFVAALLTVTACNSKSSSSSDQSSASATTGADNGASTEPSAEPSSGGAMAAAGSSANSDVPAYPGAVTQASGSSNNAMGSAAGTVMTSDDSFDKVYSWYQQHMPAGSEKSHVTAPTESAVFMLGEAGKDQTSVTLTTSAGKTMISVAHVKM
jgi:hypothetical protein